VGALPTSHYPDPRKPLPRGPVSYLSNVGGRVVGFFCGFFIVHFKFSLCTANLNKIEILFIFLKFGSKFLKEVWNYENFMIF
jgi:hypothetical protein